MTGWTLSGRGGRQGRNPGGVRELHRNIYLKTAAIAALSLIILSARPPSAEAQGVEVAQGPTTTAVWQVSLAEGVVRWRQLAGGLGDGAWQPVEAGLALVPPAEVETGEDGRIGLIRMGEVVRAGPGTRLTLQADRDLWTRIRQAVGKAWYGVRSGMQRRFQVDTQYMVATVKGTQFEIEAGPEGDRMSVQEGVVTAAPAGGGESLDVAAGQSVVATAAGLTLIAAPGTDGGDGNGGTGRPAAPSDPAPAAPQGQPGGTTGPGGGGNTGNAHGVNQGGQHNHAGEGGAAVRDEHSNAASPNAGGSKARGPKD